MRRLVLLVAACGTPASPPAPDAVVWSTCADDPRATPETLAQKAAAYDTRALALHTTPQTPWVLDVQLAPGTDPETATAADVVAWRSGENDGLWSSLVLAAEAYRFATTHEPAARTALATLLHGEQLRMQITGVPGLFTRQLIPPGVTGLACPTDPAAYVPSPDKTANVWVRIGSDGCAQTSDGTAFHSTTHCGLDAFASWCFLDNISQDEYVGHVFALGAVVRLVDDPELHAIGVDLLSQIGHHLADHAMEFVDWDGRPTRWGKLHPGADGDSPGYLAVLGASVMATAHLADPSLAVPDPAPYLDQVAIWYGPDGCTSNWNDISMLTASFFALPDLQPEFDATLVAPPRGILTEHNAWYDLLYAAHSPSPAVVRDAACALREFPRSNHLAARMATAPAACTGRFDEPLAAAPFTIADRCAATFAWWGNPYAMQMCADDPTLVQNPAGYLLPYWMARYHGFVTATD
jgi:hypothetical protein